MSKIPLSLNCTVDRLENSKAVLRIVISQDQQELIIPKRFLPADIKEGDILEMEFFNQKSAKNKQKKLASEILSEILHVDNK